MRKFIQKILNKKYGPDNSQSGMSYVELIVVLSIFSVMTSVVLFNYGGFQAKVDIKNLASDIALKVVEAQKSSLSGKLSTQPFTGTGKPSYGVYFDITTPQQFIYFADFNNNNIFDGSDCDNECLEKITITKDNTISSLKVFYLDGTFGSLGDVTIAFKRPNSGAILNTSLGFASVVSYVEITITSPKGSKAIIKVYPSGRIQVN